MASERFRFRRIRSNAGFVLTGDEQMLGAVDVHYRNGLAVAALVLFDEWQSDSATAQYVQVIKDPLDYESGQFFKRELPCILWVLNKATTVPDTIIIDGYVWLAIDKPGLGAHLFEELGEKIPIVGIAKTIYKGSDAIPVMRGKSVKPIFVTAAGIAPDIAAAHVSMMYGDSRLPHMIKFADTLARNYPT